MKNETMPVWTFGTDSINFPSKKIEIDEGREGESGLDESAGDESDDELGEDGKSADTHAEDESDDELGEKEEYDDGLDLEDESDDE